jgi:hypothetical protein
MIFETFTENGDPMNPILKKLFFKNQEPVLLLGLPTRSFKSFRKSSGLTHTSPTGKYGFILAHL